MLFETLASMNGDTKAGASYYRLKRTAPNGDFVYSPLVMVVNGRGGVDALMKK